MNYEMLDFHPDPTIVDGIITLTVLYFLAVGPARSWLAPEEPFPKRQAVLFSLGTFVLWLAVATPLDPISEQYLFSAHMFQHILLIYPVALLWLWGLPGWLLKPFFEMEWSRPLARLLTKPLPAFLAFNGAFYIWHIPAFYEWALRDSKIHFVEHACFLFTALLLWWPLIHPIKEMPRFHPGGQLLYVLAGSIIQMPLFGFLAFGESVFYPTYRNAPRLTIGGYTPFPDALSDQMMGGVMMKITAMLFMFGAMVIIFTRWYMQQEGGRRRRPVPVSAQAGLANEPLGVTNTLQSAESAQAG